MRKLVSGLALAVVVSLFLVSVVLATDTKTDTNTAGGDGPQPAIVIPEMRHDMGEVFEMDKYKHVFKVKNNGDAELVIKNVKPG
jgi:hypothetical protein